MSHKDTDIRHLYLKLPTSKSLEQLMLWIYEKDPEIEQYLIENKPFRITKNLKLTKTEYEITHKIIAGLSTKEIASLKNKSIHTINHHIRNIYMKLGVKNRQQLVNVVNKSNK